MNLQGSLAKFLKTGSIFYKKRADCFDQNQIVREAWLRLAEDMDVQASSLKTLPAVFWEVIKTDDRQFFAESIGAGFPIKGSSQPCDATSLEESIGKSLSLEEPVVLRIYAPVIRKLRTAWTNRALDFYVIVKSHVTGLMRLASTYCGDPALIQKATSLLENFEREAQEPEVIVIPKVPKRRDSGRRAAAGRVPKPKVRTARKQGRKTPSRPLAARARSVSKSAKPLVRKIGISPRRARR